MNWRTRCWADRSMSCRRRRGGVLGMIEDWVQDQVQQHALARSAVRLTRRQLRSVCGMSDAAIRVHLERLITMEYVRAAGGPQRPALRV